MKESKQAKLDKADVRQGRHTPGPWYATGMHVQSAAINEDNYVCTTEGDTPSECRANARLIAAAPNLLAFVEGSLLDHLANCSCDCYEEACKLIAKAKGE